MQPTEERFCDNCGIFYRGKRCPNCAPDRSHLVARIIAFLLCFILFGIILIFICMQKKGRSDPEKLDNLVNELSTFKEPNEAPAKK